MPDVLEQLEQFLREQKTAVRSEEEDTWRKRVEDKLDQLANGSPHKTRRDLLEELAGDDALLAELEAELASEADDLDDDDDEDDEQDDDGEDDDGEDEEEEQTSGIRWRRVPLEVPRIYSGEDEPDHVEYIDEEGKVKVRAGRKRGQPVSEEWHEVEDDDEDEPDNDDEQEDDDE